jgi:hypothetical protein
MIFADMIYEGEYGAVHNELLAHLRNAFKSVEAGHQGDSWIWIVDGGDKVAIDTFSSMRHQVKSSSPGPHVQAVIDVLRQKYKLRIYDVPELEAHEE